MNVPKDWKVTYEDYKAVLYYMGKEVGKIQMSPVGSVIFPDKDFIAQYIGTEKQITDVNIDAIKPEEKKQYKKVVVHTGAGKERHYLYYPSSSDGRQLNVEYLIHMTLDGTISYEQENELVLCLKWKFPKEDETKTKEAKRDASEQMNTLKTDSKPIKMTYELRLPPKFKYVQANKNQIKLFYKNKYVGRIENLYPKLFETEGYQTDVWRVYAENFAIIDMGINSYYVDEKQLNCGSYLIDKLHLRSDSKKKPKDTVCYYYAVDNKNKQVVANVRMFIDKGALPEHLMNQVAKSMYVKLKGK